MQQIHSRGVENALSGGPAQAPKGACAYKTYQKPVNCIFFNTFQNFMIFQIYGNPRPNGMHFHMEMIRFCWKYITSMKINKTQSLGQASPGRISGPKVYEFLIKIKGLGQNSNRKAPLYKNSDLAVWLAWLCWPKWCGSSLCLCPCQISCISI